MCMQGLGVMVKGAGELILAVLAYIQTQRRLAVRTPR